MNTIIAWMLSDIFTKRNLEILVFIAEHEYHIRDIADELGCSPAKVHNAVKLFNQYGLVKEENLKNKKIIRADRESPLFRKILELIRMEESIREDTEDKQEVKQ